ncbi:hypothetical protein BDN71DRAFT_1436958 [Pleurotus eryngii]|uniref:Uncharacterized protein n=1 Tax=Pleurotus eryngii TaxID=5323 RepID=A0A9P5ZFW0_PLEER|nr:hypothetical protein BDN71DRAFT_1436958 [Pleurotus eryngii]
MSGALTPDFAHHLTSYATKSPSIVSSFGLKALGTTNLLLRADAQAPHSSPRNEHAGTPSPNYRPAQGHRILYASLTSISSHLPSPSFIDTVDLLRCLKDPALLKEPEAEIERDCEWLRGFLSATQPRQHRQPGRALGLQDHDDPSQPRRRHVIHVLDDIILDDDTEGGTYHHRGRRSPSSPARLSTPARANIHFGVALPKDVSLRITNSVFANKATVYKKGFKCMDIGGITTSASATRPLRPPRVGRLFRQILRLPVRPRYGVVFEHAILRLVAVTVDNSYAVSFLLAGRCFGLTTFIMQLLQESHAHSWDLRDPSALLESSYFILALKKTANANLPARQNTCPSSTGEQLTAEDKVTLRALIANTILLGAKVG